jgi:uncharacterized protein Smg (DUF494 family)
MNRIMYVMPDEYPQFTNDADYKYVKFDPEQLTYDLSRCGYDVEHIESILSALRKSATSITEE